MMKQYTISKKKVYRTGSVTQKTGTLEQLVEYFSYTLECGKCYEHEKGNKKINTSPKSIKSIVSNINNASDNSALNGDSGCFYSEVK